MASPLGRYAEDTPDDFVNVELLQAPLRVWQRATEHHDDLMREMALLALSPTPQVLPERLLELIEVLGNRYGAARERPDDEREAALAAGQDRIDLRYTVPRSAATAAQQMRALLTEAEEYCRSALLTVSQPELQNAFNQWYVEQFVRQAAGEPPVPWPGPWD